MSLKIPAGAGLSAMKIGMNTWKAALSCGAIALATCSFAPPAAAQKLPVITITGVAENVNSAKISFTPIAGAQDYRVYDVTDPSKVKYAGQWHLTAGWGGCALNFAHNPDGSLVCPLTTVPANSGQQNGELATVPAWQIEWNGLPPGQQETLVVEAVDALGPVPSGNLYRGTDNSALEACTDGMCMVGSNEGITLDGLLSTNGQGPSTNTPHVIARSQPFIVGTSTTLPITPSSLGSRVFEPFSTATITQTGVVDNQDGNTQYAIKGLKTWQTTVLQADVAHTTAFIENGHFMDVLFDGGTPGLSSLPTHNNHAALALSPAQTVAIGNNHILHVTMEVDSHNDNRRWVGIVIAPSNDPVQSFYSNQGFRVNNSNNAFFAEILGSSFNFVQETGPATGASGTQVVNSYYRPFMFGPQMTPALGSSTGPSPMMPTGQQYMQYGVGLDNRTRFDLFLSSTHATMYENGMKFADQDLAQPLGFPRCKIYFAHYVYHTTNEVLEDSLYTPWETYWLNSVPYSDERHWSNMGCEVLPNSAEEWTDTAELSQPIAFQAPTFAPGG